MEHIQWTLWINFAVNFGSTSPVPQPPCLDCLEEKCEKVCHTVSLKKVLRLFTTGFLQIPLNTL